MALFHKTSSVRHTATLLLKGWGQPGNHSHPVNSWWLMALVVFWVWAGPALALPGQVWTLKEDALQDYVARFNADDEELYTQAIPNAGAFDFLRSNVPLLDCPDKELERTYYFRWWTLRKHIKQTPDGFILTEFLPPVPWAGKQNSINCPAGHHYREARWLRDTRYLDDYSVFWFRKGGAPRRYSFWAADSLWARGLVTGDFTLARDLLPDLITNHVAWERTRRDANGLFWQNDGEDGMEVSIGGTGYRATINSYMFGDAVAMARLAEVAGKADVAKEFQAKAETIRRLLNTSLWDQQAQFYKVASRVAALAQKSAGILEWKVNNDPLLAKSARASASHCWERDTTAALNDGREPASSADERIPRLTFWEHQGTAEWVQYDFPAPVLASNLQVYWFQDTAGCRVPKEWRALCQDGSGWQPVKNLERYRTAPDRFNQLGFEPVRTKALRLEIVCQGLNETPTTGSLKLSDARELHGYTPWYFEGLAEPQMAVAWRQIMDPQGFFAPFGPTTAEQRHPKFQVAYAGHECQWNGPSWPYSTAITLTALANQLNGDPQNFVSRADYYTLLRNYALSHRLKRADGRVVCWIDENLNPHTGDWIARILLQQRKQKPAERGKDYNHSTYCDLVINGLIGVRPQVEDKIVVNPLVPEGTWDWFCLDRTPYHGRMLTVLWDKTGQHYGKGQGLRVLADGREIAAAPVLKRLEATLPPAKRSNNESGKAVENVQEQ